MPNEPVTREIHTVVDVSSSIDEYLSQSDWRVNANANQGYSLGGLILNVSGKVTANYWLNHVYSLEVGEAHREGSFHVHDLDMLSGYCAGWSLRALLTEGFNGVPDKIEASPPKHMSSAIGQIVNFLGTLQNEWAGAQAFSSFDTYMAPFIRKDRMSFKEVRQNIQELIFNLNVPSRWGCVDTETEVLSTEGWKRYDELQVGNIIYTWKEGKLSTCPVNNVIIKEHTGDMHSYQGRNYHQFITPNHRAIIYEHNSLKTDIRVSEDIFSVRTPYRFPTKFKTSQLPASNVLDPEIILAASLYTDGSIDTRGGKIHHVSYIKSKSRLGAKEFENSCNMLGLEFTKTTHYSDIGSDQGYPQYECWHYRLSGESARKAAELIGKDKTQIASKFLTMGSEQSNIFLRTWMSHDGELVKLKAQCDNDQIADAIQHIALRAGYTSYIKTRTTKNGHLTRYVKLRQHCSIYPTERVKVAYSGQVWCPNSNDGTAVFRKDGNVFISGNTQTPFTNLTFDWTCPEDLKTQIPIIGGVEMPFVYGDLQAEMDMLNKAYIEVMTTGDAKGRVFTFPIPTYNITPEFPWESKNSKRLFEMTAKYGLPYFQNFINSELNPSMVRSMCCRLQLDLRELLKRGNGLFGSAEQTGSIGVVTINCARLGYEYKDNERGLFIRLDYLLNLAKDSLERKRKTIQKYMDSGLFPYTKRYLGTLRNHFSTIGINGVNEMIRNFSSGAEDITTKQGNDLATTLLDHLRSKMLEFQEETGHMYNLEATPAEGTTYRFAREDKKRYPEIIQAGTEEAPFYTNSSQLPVGFTDDPFEALSRQEELQSKYTGGTVLHLYLGEQVSSSEACKKLVKRALENYRLPYITITPTFSICPIHGYLSGEHEFCPKCDMNLIKQLNRSDS